MFVITRDNVWLKLRNSRPAVLLVSFLYHTLL
jgi:hypothetical protein